ncbi:hypothetical protein EIP86_008327 [Pleurotus ostreatoroseus]|nr:hypothetical protein EIP86_008327 [Pleurotus ostreatoroseus]
MSRDDNEMWTSWRTRQHKEQLPYVSPTLHIIPAFIDYDSPFKNEMVCKARDLQFLPLRLRQKEDKERDKLLDLMSYLKEKHGNPDVWCPIFVGMLRARLDELVFECYMYRNVFENPAEGPDSTPLALDGFRRRIAMLHEVIDLYEQGPGDGAYWHAWLQGDLVLRGRRRVFKKYYGF